MDATQITVSVLLSPSILIPVASSGVFPKPLVRLEVVVVEPKIGQAGGIVTLEAPNDLLAVPCRRGFQQYSRHNRILQFSQQDPHS